MVDERAAGPARERVEADLLERTLGPLADVGRLAGGHARSLREDGSIEVELQALVGATNPLGAGRLHVLELSPQRVRVRFEEP